MKRTFLTVALPCALVVAGTVGAAFAHDPKQPAPMQPMAGQSAGSIELHRVMMSGQKMPMPPMSGNVDTDFARMMTMHHEQAIKMVDVMLKQGHNTKLQALAAKMKAAQKNEIKTMAPYAK